MPLPIGITLFIIDSEMPVGSCVIHRPFLAYKRWKYLCSHVALVLDLDSVCPTVKDTDFVPVGGSEVSCLH